MATKHTTPYTIGFAVAVCLVCSVFVSLSAVALRSRQEENRLLDRQMNVLKAAGLIAVGEVVSAARVTELFTTIVPVVVDLQTGEVVRDLDPSTVDMKAATASASTSREVRTNPAGILRVPHHGVAYQLQREGQVEVLILPVSGKGLWSTLNGFLALDIDTTTIRGISFYEHGETPGLGGEVENPKWTALFENRKVFDAQWIPVFQVIKGIAGEPDVAPHQVDGLSGATLTGNGVTSLIRFWMGDDGFGPFLSRFRKGER